MLDDGVYDAIVVDATHIDAQNDATRAHITIELVIASGARKGEVVALRARDEDIDPIDVLGLPATLIVENGVPRVHLER
jgi:integrase